MIKKGFTLVELLIVISIVAILSGITLSVINVSRVKSRAQNGVRKEDLSTIAGGLERYYADNNVYPGGTGALSPAYLKAIPVDPLGGAYSYGLTNGDQGFCVCTQLQDEIPPASDKHNCTISGNYCVVNPF